MNFEEEVQCPYDKSHQIRKKRLTKHLIACRRNHPDVVKVICPFNNDHILNPQELDHHVTMCTDRKSFENFRTIFKIPITPTQEPNMPEYQSEDNWDAELGTSSYNPQQYVKTAAVIRNIIGAPPRERKKFRLEEHLRLQGMLNPK